MIYCSVILVYLVPNIYFVHTTCTSSIATFPFDQHPPTTQLSLSTNTFFVKELLNHRADLKERKGPICFPIHLVWSLFHKTAYQKDALYQAFQNSRISKHLDQEPKFIKHHQKRQYFLCKIRESGSTLSSESLLHFQCFIQNW